MKLKPVFTVLILIGMLIAYIGYKLYTKPHQDIEQLKPDLTATADQILADYQDEQQGNTKYLGKIVEVSGTILELNTGQNNTHQIVLDTGDMMARVSCELDYLVDHPKLANYKIGDQIRLKGLGAGMVMDIVLDRCVILE